MLPHEQAIPRSWLFVPGHDPARLDAALASAAEAIIVDLEEFTPAAERDSACQAFAAFAARCRRQGRLPMVRINRLDRDGAAELEALIKGAPSAIFLPQVESSQALIDLALTLDDAEHRHSLSPGQVGIVPTLESRIAIDNAAALLCAPRLNAALIGTGDLAGDLELSPDEAPLMLRPYRRRFLEVCRQAEVLAIDGPWPMSDGFADDQAWAMRQGFRARCVVDPVQIPFLHAALSAPPQAE
ncbi:citrate lyase subunit beta / citryl-CoA lyase [Modicisalibacter ilicicola DSM 19980]|uniref:Citrate lyase subunit beta / citryl-CoA lyase n=1 Tax=Modicisalibacter ilicicola DSM 19980 TaxID=1121942 RepID=A0A1M5B1L3_9GAMM|nr:aldolase/citrate lyase family protein [Halomonas ilicicola]SHF36320.1 citrate lyase subunit beta / citryl-CoA lyase [Halomonas ilicicola DSM 19980]